MARINVLVVVYWLVLFVLSKTGAYKRVCYYTNWSQYRPGDGKYTAASINPHLCSHIIIAFAKIDGTSLKPLEWNDEKTYKDINALKDVNKDLKTMVAVGGWNAASGGFTILVASQKSRQAFIQSAIAFLRKYDFDGLDLDWEYPTKRGGNPSDKENFVFFVMELKQAFIEEGKRIGKAALLLTAAVPVGKEYIDSGYEVPQISKYLDFINLMSYDIHGSWEKQTGENSPLYPMSSESGAQRYLNIEWAAEYWVRKGTPRQKLIIGLATYGRSFTLVNKNNFAIGAPARGSGQAGKYTREKGFLSYYEICLKQKAGGRTYRDTQQKVPYYVDGNLWAGFDDVESIRLKTEWIKQKGFGGAMIWSLALDDFAKICPTSDTAYPLLTTINNVLNGGSNHTTTTTAATTTTSGSPTTSTVTTQSTSQLTTKTSHTTTTMTSTTTHTSESFSCRGRPDGFYADPESRHWYYRCVNGVPFHFQCAPGTVYDPKMHICTWQ